MSYIYFTRTGFIDPFMFEEKMNGINSTELARIMKLKLFEDRVRALAGRLLLTYALKQSDCYSGDASPEISYSAHKRPYWQSSHSDFNISHSADIVAFAYCLEGKIGIDIEKIVPVNFSDYVLVFTPNEMFEISTSRNPLEKFFYGWTRKESVLKAEGSGFFFDPLKLSLESDQFILAGEEWFVSDLNIADNYAASVACNRPINPKVKEVFWDELICPTK